MNGKYLVIAGPTASGKTELAIRLAQELKGELVCCDSVQLYSGFCIGASGPTPDEMHLVPHHLFYSLQPHDDFDAASYRDSATASMTAIWSRGNLPIVVGGTGLYLRALIGRQWSDNLPSDQNLREELRGWTLDQLVTELEHLDPARLREIHRNDRYRLERSIELCKLLGVPMSSQKSEDTYDENAFFVQIIPDRKKLHNRIEKRVLKMIELGFIDEVKKLRSIVDRYDTCKPLSSIGYKQVGEYLDGVIDMDELLDRVIAATRQYAKRQCTWFKKMPVHLKLHEIPSDLNQTVFAIKNFMNS